MEKILYGWQYYVTVWMCIRTTRCLYLCMRVVQLNCVKVKVQCMAYRKVGVCCRVYYFWLFISLNVGSASVGSDAAETSSCGQQREQSVGWVAGVIDDSVITIVWCCINKSKQNILSLISVMAGLKLLCTWKTMSLVGTLCYNESWIELD